LPLKDGPISSVSSRPRVRAHEVEADAAVTDELLMIRYQRGDSEAFGWLVRRHNQRLYNFILRLVKNPSAAEELAQEAFLKIVKNSASFKHEARFSTWLYAIARNLCIDHQRKQRLRRHNSLDQPANQSQPTDQGSRTLGETVADPHPSSNVERSVTKGRMAEAMVGAVEALPDDQKEVFLLRELGGLPFKDIAEVTGVGENTVKSRMRYALERLQQALEAYKDHAQELK
jgi:RNA polymerase sigma-70 factor, ECF subfamily